MQLSLLDIYNQMGNFAKGIVYLLAIMSVWTLSVAIKKWWDLRQAQGETRKFAPEFSQFLEEDNLTEAVTLADKYKKSHVARVLGGALTEIRPLIQDGSVTVGDINSAERAIEREMLMTITDLKRGLGVMATVGATAPFVGLLGTTMGIVNSFGRVRGAHHDRIRSRRRDPGGVALQLLPDQDRQSHRRDDLHLEGDDRLHDQERHRNR